MANFEPFTIVKSKESLKGKTLFITGASRGIGYEIGLRAAKEGANIVIAAKTTEPHPKLEGTIYTAAADMVKAGGKALAVVCDVRDEKSVAAAVAKAVETFGGIDVLVNNASAIYQSSVEETDMKHYDLSMSINTRGTFLCSKYCIPHLRKAKNPHILTISPPLQAATDLKVNWFARYCTGYVFSKLGMTFVTHGLSEELREDGIACNTLWPRTMVGTAVVQNLLGGEDSMQKSRSPLIMSDAAFEIITGESKTTTGNFFIDDEVLLSVHGQQFDMGQYRLVKGAKETDLYPDIIM
ncbi:hypothetical protein FGO68_gene7501 [Halteria grandinella]|uniref:Hydroxysteroid dehydrogenase-like protein 2 n=1 Tax=Halteria grandinella TaxID=5974 RepID=A0A8J8NKE5_HALGN|nr:hypothetical protein FGO68_gene7501 [Halteria grandinella]